MKRFFILVFILFGIILVYWPSVMLNFSLIDDGQIIQVKRNIVSSLKNNQIHYLGKYIFEPDVGRVRPFYWLMQSTLAFISFESPALFHLYRIIILLLTVILLYRLLRVLNVNIFISILGLIGFIFNIQNIENYFRLGPTESYLGLFLLIILNLIFKSPLNKTYTYLSLFVVSLLACGTKETFSILFLLFFILSFTGSNNYVKKYSSFISKSILVFSTFIFLIKLSYPVVSNAYSSHYQIEIKQIIFNLSSYFFQIQKYQSPYFFVILAYIIVSILNPITGFLKAKQNNYVAIFLFSMFINLLILLPWKYAIGRYLLLVNISLIVSFCLIFQHFLWEIIKPLFLKYNFLQIGLVIIFLAFFAPYNLIEAANLQYFQSTDAVFTTSLLNSVARILPPNSVLVNNYIRGDDNIEIYLETLWHLQLFYDRWDLNYEYLDNSNLCTKIERYVLDRRSTRFINPKLLNDQLTLVASSEATLTQIRPEIVFKDFILLSSSPKWETFNRYDWQLYKQPPNSCIKV